MQAALSAFSKQNAKNTNYTISESKRIYIAYPFSLSEHWHIISLKIFLLFVFFDIKVNYLEHCGDIMATSLSMNETDALAANTSVAVQPSQVDDVVQEQVISPLRFLLILAIAILIIVIWWLQTDFATSLKVIAIFLASLFPISAVAYYNFKKESQVEELTKSLLLLGIVLQPSRRQTAPHYEQFVKQEVRERYERYYSLSNFILQSGLTFVLALVGMSIIFRPTFDSELFPQIAVDAVRFGFIGAYIFSLQLVYRRYTTIDLQPTVYLNCALTIIAGIAFNYVAFGAIHDIFISQSSAATAEGQVTGAEAGLLAVIAFSLGYFPSLALRWFNRLTYTALGVDERRADVLSLSLVDGISPVHETRLRDEGVDNIQNLASADIVELLLNTRFGVEQIVEWIDQSILYLYLDQNEIRSFLRGKIRSITDFHDAWEALYPFTRTEQNDGTILTRPKWKDANDNFMIPDWVAQQRLERAQQLQETPSPERLDTLYIATQIGANIHYIHNFWSNIRHTSGRIAIGSRDVLAKMGVLEANRVLVENQGKGDQSPSLAGPQSEQETTQRVMENAEYNLLLRKALNYGDEKDYERAFEFFEEAITLNPTASYAYELRAELHQRRKEYREALHDFDVAVQLALREGAGNIAVLIATKRAHMFADKGDVENAQADLERIKVAVVENPEDYVPSPYESLVIGIVQTLRGEYTAAFDSISLYIKDKATSGWGYYYLGRLYEAQNRINEAIEAYTKATTAQVLMWSEYDDDAKSRLERLKAMSLNSGQLGNGNPSSDAVLPKLSPSKRNRRKTNTDSSKPDTDPSSQ